MFILRQRRCDIISDEIFSITKQYLCMIFFVMILFQSDIVSFCVLIFMSVACGSVWALQSEAAANTVRDKMYYAFSETAEKMNSTVIFFMAFS